MTLRFSGAAPVPEKLSDEPAAAGPGTRYLAERKRRLAARPLPPALGALRAALAPLVRDERVDATGPGCFALHHLLRHGLAGDYRARVAAQRPRLAEVHLTTSGPWPPYAFAPEALA
jgi:hypothetical protein